MAEARKRRGQPKKERDMKKEGFFLVAMGLIQLVLLPQLLLS